jgi:hypothetical protein
VAEWIVKAPPGTVCPIEIVHDRAGTLRTTATLR